MAPNHKRFETCDLSIVKAYDRLQGQFEFAVAESALEFVFKFEEADRTALANAIVPRLRFRSRQFAHDLVWRLRLLSLLPSAG